MLSNKFKTIGGRCSAGWNAEVRGSADTLNIYLELLAFVTVQMLHAEKYNFKAAFFCRVYENMHMYSSSTLGNNMYVEWEMLKILRST